MDGVTETLAAVGREIRSKFRHLERSEAVNEPTWGKCDNERQRFEVWARNLGLYSGGHSSLDYRFRDAQLLFDHTLSLLNDFARTLAQLLRVVESEEIPNEQEISDDSEQEDVSSYQEKPLFELLTESASATIDKLYRLAFKIRNPATRLGSSKALGYCEVDKETGVDLIEQFSLVDHQYIRDLFHSYDSSHTEDYYLIPRLAKANTRRRQQFRYWKKCREAFELLSLADLVDEDTGLHHKDIPRERQVHLAVPGIGLRAEFSTSQPSTPTCLNSEKVKPEDDMSVISAVSFLPSQNDQDADSVFLPPPPLIGPEVKEFECPYCFTMCPQKLANQKEWGIHILRDLRPYVCTYQDCKTLDQPYDNLSDWINHEVLNHGEDGNSHGREEGSSFSKPPPARRCPFCAEDAVSPFHIATHLHRIAAFSLPRSVGDDDSSDITRASNRVDMSSDEFRLSVSSFNSTPESEDSEDVLKGPSDEQLKVQVMETRKSKFGVSMYSRWKKAEQLEVQGMETSKTKLGADHPDTLTRMANVASMYRELGRWKKAEQLEVRVMKTRQAEFGVDHPDTLTSMANLASTYRNQGRWKKAEQLEVQVMETSKTKLGADHPDTLTSMANLASTYRNQGRWDEAEQLEVQVMETRLASTYRMQGRWEEAEQLEVQVMETSKTKLGADHPDTLTSMANLAFTWKSSGYNTRALGLLKDCLAKQNQVLGLNHPDTISNSQILLEWETEMLNL
ncbi:hypothetical protein BJX66DRAFT_320644 [Aspergillus keveii]|uniref:Oxidoreductase acuF-like C2H2 type zinc-finger domain-containing protein n=1 Tax=Aspergillus keveii TaxID=714993 RepID=A0ABR4FGW3_9EURO